MTALLKLSLHTYIHTPTRLGCLFFFFFISALARRYQICDLDQTPYLPGWVLTRCLFLCSYNTYLGYTGHIRTTCCHYSTKKKSLKNPCPPPASVFIPSQPALDHNPFLYVQIQSWKKKRLIKRSPVCEVYVMRRSPNRRLCWCCIG